MYFPGLGELDLQNRYSEKGVRGDIKLWASESRITHVANKQTWEKLCFVEFSKNISVSYRSITNFPYRLCVCVYVSEHDSVYTVHSIELKFGMYIAGRRQTNTIDFDEYWNA